MKAITADSHAGRMLLALRGGPHSAAELGERFGSYFHALQPLLKAGLAVGDADEYRITEAGRLACPYRNPLAAKPATPPEVFSMPKGEINVTRQRVLAVIEAGGVAGITRKALIEKFSARCSEQCIDMHITALNRQTPPVIFKPKPGVMVGIAHKPADETEAAKIEPKKASTATDEWIPEPLATDPAKGAVSEYAARLSSFVPITQEDIRLDDAATVEFAIYSSGGLDIFSKDCAITLGAPVLKKLRTFLGLLAEAA